MSELDFCYVGLNILDMRVIAEFVLISQRKVDS